MEIGFSLGFFLGFVAAFSSVWTVVVLAYIAYDWLK